MSQNYSISNNLLNTKIEDPVQDEEHELLSDNNSLEEEKKKTEDDKSRDVSTPSNANADPKTLDQT